MINGKLRQELEEILTNEERKSEQPTADVYQPQERVEPSRIEEILHGAQKAISFVLCLDLVINWGEYRNSIDYTRNAPALRSKIAREHLYDGARRTLINLCSAGAAAVTFVTFRTGYDVVALLSAGVTLIPFIFARALYKQSFVTKYWG